MSGRRVSRNQTDVEQKTVLRVAPKVADGLTPYRKASLEGELNSGDFVEGGTLRGSVLVRGTSEPPPTNDGTIRRGEWIPTSSGENKRSVNSSPKTAVGAVAHSDMFLRKDVMNKKASGAGFSSSQTGSGSSAGGSVERLAPEVYSPLFTMANLNLPRDRITVNAWCFLPETKVWLADGTRKNIEDIKIGDKVLSGNGNIRKVTTIFKREIDEEIVGIKIKGGQDIIWTTKNHNFNAIKSNDVRCCNKDIYVKCKPSNNDKKFCKWCNRRDDPYNFIQISAGELERLDSVYMPIPNHTIRTEDSILNSVDGMQLLGYYVAEGSISRETGVYFNFGLHEEKLCYFIADQLYKIWGGPNKPIVRKREEKGGIQIEYHNKKASLFFRTHCGEGALTKKISDELLYAEPELLIHFLSTWLDGDGGQEKYNKNIFCGNTSSCNLAYQIRLMALRCGLVAHVFKEKTSKIKLWKNNRICNQADRYFVKIRGSAANMFSKKISSCVSRFNEIERQYNRDGYSFIYNNKLIQWIDGIQKRNYKGSVYNIEVEGDHTYVVGYGVSVHNCRNFFQLHPIVRNAITLHATYPISKINIKCHDKKVLQFFEDMIEEMGLMESLGDIALEYWKLGEKIQGSSLITMSDGSLKPIKNINTGDIVLTHLGNKKRVVDKFIKPTNKVVEDHLKVYKVSVMGLSEPLIISGKHPILLTKQEEVFCKTPSCNKKRIRVFPEKKYCSNCRKLNIDFNELSPQFVEMNDINAGDIVYSPFDKEVVHNEQFNEDLCYLMGFWLAEGSFCKAKRSYGTKYNGIKFTSYDKQYIDLTLKPLLKKCFGFDGTTYKSISTGFGKGQDKYDHCLEAEIRNGPNLADFFFYHCGEYSKEKTLSKDIMLLPTQLQLQLLAGFIDGDGCVDKSNGHFVIATSSKNLANQIVFILRRAGCHPTISSVEADLEKNIAKKYRIKVVANEAHDVFKPLLKSKKSELLYKTKWSSPNSSLYNSWQVLYIKKIEDITEKFDEEFMYDLEVEDDHSYIANGVAIHNCFPYAELDEKSGKWSKIVIQNPDYCHVKKTVLSGEPIILLKPDAVLQRLVMSSNPADVQLRKQIPEKIIYHVRAGQDIPLDNFNVSHLKMLSSPYDVRGTSVIVGVFKDLMLYDKLREAKFAQADGMINPITIIKVGGNADGDFRATQEDIEFFRQIFEEAQYDKDFKLITHAGISVERIGFSGQVLEIGPDMELIVKNIYTGLMIPPAVVDTESAVYASASIGLEVLRQRYFNFRNMMASWLSNKIFAPISEIQDFYEYEGGIKRLIVPEVEWNQMNLYDLQDYIQNISGLVSQKQASLQTLYRSLGLSYQDEIVKMRQEMIRDSIRMKEEENLRKMTITELRALDPEKEILEPVDSKEREATGGAPGAGGMPEAGGMPGMGGAPEIPGGLGGLAGPGGGPELAPPGAGPAPSGGTPPGSGPAPMPGGPPM